MVPCQAGSVSPSCTSGGNWSTKIENYLKIRFDSGANTWTVWSKDGKRLVYSPTVTVPPHAFGPGGTLRWGVSSAIDTDGNTVSYTWHCPSGEWECYPSSAAYNGYAVSFFHEARPDVLSWAGASVLGKTTSRLRSVIVWAPSQSAHIRGYKLSYQTSPMTGRSLLTSLQQYGKDLVHSGGVLTGGTTLPAQTFTYQNDTIGKSFQDWGPTGSPRVLTEPVTWANLVNAIPAGSGSSLYKSTGWSSWDAGADSTRALASGNGYLEWISSEPASAGKAAGLNHGSANVTLADIDYAFFEAESSQLYASENGTLYGPWSRSTGDVLRIEVISGVVYFKQNGVVRRQSSQTPLFPLRAVSPHVAL